MDRTYSLSELAEQTGLSERTIRYYISADLLAGPYKKGRGARYSEAHFEVLQKIRRLQRQGMTLRQIWDRIHTSTDPSFAQPKLIVSTWKHHRIGNDVLVEVREDIHPQRKNLIKKALGEFARAVDNEGDSHDS